MSDIVGNREYSKRGKRGEERKNIGRGKGERKKMGKDLEKKEKEDLKQIRTL